MTAASRARTLLHQPAGVALGSVAVVAGAAIVVIAAFLPWLKSGETLRSSFQTTRLLERFHVLPDAVQPLVPLWPVLPPLVVLPLLLIALRCWRWAGASAAVLAMVFAFAAGGGLYYGADVSALGVSLATDGPVLMIAGAAVLFGGGLTLLVAGYRRRPV
ncbi:hypothetical protein [Nakamurella aerolata]|uniref:Uncharacterized protein n=1 Tax=Nakamurella aerolata TaxID=1656892 RepID=A0A848ZZS1_9ACTN|nr:hypothetical protein [Nakamurella aerolata]NNG34314.1 hypothetical protein [Nakamurella aerolata]